MMKYMMKYTMNIPNLVLSSKIPHREGQVLVLYGFNIESQCWHSVSHFSNLQLVQYCRLPSSIQTEDKETNILLSEPEFAKNFGEKASHGS